MLLVYLNMLTQSIAITDSIFNFGKFVTKKHTELLQLQDI